MEDRMRMTIVEQYGYDSLSNEENAKVTQAWDKAQTSVSILFKLNNVIS